MFIHQGSSYKPFEVTAYAHKLDKFFQLATDNSGSRDCRIASVDNFAYICRVVDCGGGLLMNSLLRFDPRQLTSHELTPCPRLRLDPALAACGRCLYLFGGATDTYVILDSVDCYNIVTDTWTACRPLPAPTHALSAVAVPSGGGGAVYVSGGLERQTRAPVTSLTLYDTRTGVYTPRAPMHCARRLHEMCYVAGGAGRGDDSIYALGGIADHSYSSQSSIAVEAYSLAADQWTLIDATTLAGRAVGHFVVFNDAVLSIGREQPDATEEEIRRFRRGDEHASSSSSSWTPYARVPRRGGLSGVTVAKLKINFYDERVAKHVISDKR